MTFVFGSTPTAVGPLPTAIVAITCGCPLDAAKALAGTRVTARRRTSPIRMRRPIMPSLPNDTRHASGRILAGMSTTPSLSPVSLALADHDDVRWQVVELGSHPHLDDGHQRTVHSQEYSSCRRRQLATKPVASSASSAMSRTL